MNEETVKPKFKVGDRVVFKPTPHCGTHLKHLEGFATTIIKVDVGGGGRCIDFDPPLDLGTRKVSRLGAVHFQPYQWGQPIEDVQQPEDEWEWMECVDADCYTAKLTVGKSYQVKETHYNPELIRIKRNDSGREGTIAYKSRFRKPKEEEVQEEKHYFVSWDFETTRLTEGKLLVSDSNFNLDVSSLPVSYEGEKHIGLGITAGWVAAGSVEYLGTTKPITREGIIQIPLKQRNTKEKLFNITKEETQMTIETTKKVLADNHTGTVKMLRGYIEKNITKVIAEELLGMVQQEIETLEKSPAVGTLYIDDKLATLNKDVEGLVAILNDKKRK